MTKQQTMENISKLAKILNTENARELASTSNLRMTKKALTNNLNDLTVSLLRKRGISC